MNIYHVFCLYISATYDHEILANVLSCQNVCVGHVLLQKTMSLDVWVVVCPESLVSAYVDVSEVS